MKIKSSIGQCLSWWLVSLIIWLATTSYGSISAQLDSVTPVPVPTHLQSYTMIFPNFLYCSQAEQNITGPTWEGVVIGESSIQDILDIVSEWVDVYDVYVNYINTDVEYRLNIRNIFYRIETHGLPNSLRFCAIEDKVLILAVSYPVESNLYVNDLMASYGLPDVVSYDFGSPNSRLVFWAEQGVAAKAFSGDDDISFARVSIVIYFPPVSEDITETWPFSETISGRNDDDNDVGGLYEGEQNPFDFEAMIATITAQPSRTPTPTITPRVPSQTVTTTATPP